MRSGRVLIVQPDADSREMYSEYLRYQGVDAIAVSTAPNALAPHRTLTSS